MKKIIIIVLVLLAIIIVGAALGSDPEEPSSEPETATVETVEHRTGDEIVGVSDKDIEDLDPDFDKKVRNDVTEKWRAVAIAESVDFTEYALSCWEKYAEADDTVLVVLNYTTNVTTIINKTSDRLSVSCFEMVDGERNDAKLMGSGLPLGNYFVYLDNGDIEKL